MALSLRSRWRDRIPTALLGLMLTAELARIAVIEPVVSHPDLFRGAMWTSRAAQVQSDAANASSDPWPAPYQFSDGAAFRKTP